MFRLSRWELVFVGVLSLVWWFMCSAATVAPGGEVLQGVGLVFFPALAAVAFWLAFLRR